MGKRNNKPTKKDTIPLPPPQEEEKEEVTSSDTEAEIEEAPEEEESEEEEAQEGHVVKRRRCANCHEYVVHTPSLVLLIPLILHAVTKANHLKMVSQHGRKPNTIVRGSVPHLQHVQLPMFQVSIALSLLTLFLPVCTSQNTLMRKQSEMLKRRLLNVRQLKQRTQKKMPKNQR